MSSTSWPLKTGTERLPRNSGSKVPTDAEQRPRIWQTSRNSSPGVTPDVWHTDDYRLRSILGTKPCFCLLNTLSARAPWRDGGNTFLWNAGTGLLLPDYNMTSHPARRIFTATALKISNTKAAPCFHIWMLRDSAVWRLHVPARYADGNDKRASPLNKCYLGHPRCDAVLLSDWFPTFRKNNLKPQG
jgi:hypothetical protein